eukprot:351895-Chlamydomonas_euryale.AAC.4
MADGRGGAVRGVLVALALLGAALPWTLPERSAWEPAATGCVRGAAARMGPRLGAARLVGGASCGLPAAGDASGTPAPLLRRAVGALKVCAVAWAWAEGLAGRERLVRPAGECQAKHVGASLEGKHSIRFASCCRGARPGPIQP